jgi:hypothetical protein
MRPAVERADVDSALDLRARRALRGFPTDTKEVVDVSDVLATRAFATRVDVEARLVLLEVVVRAAAGLSALAALLVFAVLLA